MKTEININDLGTILFVGAHPDDETWAAGGLLATAARIGKSVEVFCLTSGGAGQTANEAKWPVSSLPKIRKQELRDASEVLGAGKVEVLDYDDGQLQSIDRSMLSADITQRINSLRPDTVITFSGFGLTGHPDHRAVHAAVNDALQGMQDKPRFLCAIESIDIHADAGNKLDKKYSIYMDDAEGQRILAAKADLVFELPKEALDIKMKALAKHQSQYSVMLKDSKPLLRQMLSTECYVKITE